MMQKRYKIFLLLILSGLFSVHISAQKLSNQELEWFRNQEDSLREFSYNIIHAKEPGDRLRADSNFIRVLMRTLKAKNSFHYPLSSLETISILYPPDSTFRIFTWQYTKDDNYYRQRGMIQMNTPDGELVRHPLIDMSEFTDRPADSVRTGENWIGAIYYRIIQKSYDGRNFYTLLGFDDNSIRSTKKWIEVMYFDENQQPVFGGRFFYFKSDPQQSYISRFCLEYKKDGRARVNYDEEMDLIIYDHLISETDEPQKKYTLIPDGDYEGFKWEDGRLVHIEKVFDMKLEDGQAPIVKPIKDESGKTNEKVLEEQSEKNRKRKENKNR
ncbi:MAG TPA: hypothetical protein VIK74_11975 [Parasegetibacter sp.]